MKKITIFGGDKRIQTVYEGLKNHGFLVDSEGLFEGDSADWESSDIFLLPVPATKDKINVFAPLTERKLPLSEVEKRAQNKLVLSGNHMLRTERCIDYCRSDAYAIKNAVPTAEGAIAKAIEMTPFTLWRSKILVIGYGRVGKILAERLLALHAYVTISARKHYDFALAAALGLQTIHTADISKKCEGYDIIFNTVDFPVLEESLERLRGKTDIDLSSKGGFNLDRAKTLGVNACLASALPGKTAPQTAGKILTETVLELIESNPI